MPLNRGICDVLVTLLHIVKVDGVDISSVVTPCDLIQILEDDIIFVADIIDVISCSAPQLARRVGAANQGIIAGSAVKRIGPSSAG